MRDTASQLVISSGHCSTSKKQFFSICNFFQNVQSKKFSTVNCKFSANANYKHCMASVFVTGNAHAYSIISVSGLPNHKLHKP